MKTIRVDIAKKSSAVVFIEVPDDFNKNDLHKDIYQLVLQRAVLAQLQEDDWLERSQVEVISTSVATGRELEYPSTPLGDSY